MFRPLSPANFCFLNAVIAEDSAPPPTALKFSLVARRRRGLLGLFLFLTLAPLFAAESLPEPNKAATVLLTIEGVVDVARQSTLEWKPARTNHVLAVGDRLRTGLRSRATVRMSNLSVLRVNELTTLEIGPSPAAGKGAMLDLKSGSTYFFNRSRPAEMNFNTPLVAGAIRGTEFNLAVAEDGRTVVTLLDGEVDLKNPQGELTLNSGEQGIVEPGRAPAKTAVLEAINIIQWALYYPAVLDPDEAGLSADEQQALSDSLSAYRSGDLLAALSRYPEKRQLSSDAERVQLAALLLAAGQVEQANANLKALRSPSPADRALRKVIAAVKHETFADKTTPTTASEWLAESYYLQSQSKLREALQAAREAVQKSPNFGFGWVRVAELELAFGHINQAKQTLDKGLELCPRHAQAMALKGFLLASQNRTKEAITYFDRAITLDGALGNAWLGRGLCQIREGRAEAGRQDLQVAATLEPNRSELRSYLGKAWSHTRDKERAEKELRLAQKLDPNDPTPWLYSALLNDQRNRINEAVAELEKSKELNDNRSVYRSKLLLDQDRAVRSANLAKIYQDAGMIDVSVREASRAVNYDYGNYSAHLFLANSYDALRDPKQVNLRYETPWFSELLLANLLAPVGAGTLSQNISQQEYSRLFDGDHLGVINSTEYFSSGDWVQSASQYGIVGNSSYALDAYYRSENGQRPNNDLRQFAFSAKFKQQLTLQDSVFLQALYYDAEAGDVGQYYDPNRASRTFRVEEQQEPNLFAGYHREWAPGIHTLFLAGRLDDTLQIENTEAAARQMTRDAAGNVISVRDNPGFFGSIPFDLDYESKLEAYSVELQQIWQRTEHTLIAGGRFQDGWLDTQSNLGRPANDTPPIFGDVFVNQPYLQDVTTDLQRLSIYAYHIWQIVDAFQLTAGLSYDRLVYPQNSEIAPINDQEEDQDQISPKAGFLWTPLKNTAIRGAYSRSLGGVFYDNSVRLEPTQVAGFNQAFRSLIPESVVGLVPGTEFETWGLAFDQKFKSRTYLSVAGEILTSHGKRVFGTFNRDLTPAPVTLGGTPETLDFRERSITVHLNQLVGDHWALGARYRLSEAELNDHFPLIPTSVSGSPSRDIESTLHQVNLFANFYLPGGFFAQADSVWSAQSNRGYSPAQPGDDFWQFNVYAGYRFWRRAAEIRLGLLNLTDQDYRLEPLTLYSELPRERTLTVSFKFSF